MADKAEKKARKAEFRRHLVECRKLWNEFDPIGVLNSEGPLDEYDAYLPHTIQLVLSGADACKLTSYLRQVVHVKLGMPEFPDSKIQAFAKRLLDSFD